MELSYTPGQNALRAEARAWMAAHVPKAPLASFDTPEGFAQHREWERTLHAGGWSAVTWPREYGGRGLDLIAWLVFEEEYWRAGAPGRVNQNGVFLLGPTLMEYGTPEQKARFLPPMAAGDEVWAQAWSEPQAGSDLAAVRASAQRTASPTSCGATRSGRLAPFWPIGRSACSAPSRRPSGTTACRSSCSRFAPRACGYVRFRRSTARRASRRFSSTARVCRWATGWGPEGGGWNVCMSTAGFERGLMLRSPARFQMAARRLAGLQARHGESLDPGLRSQVLQAWMDADAYALSVYATASRLIAGGAVGSEASLNKIFWSELDIDLHRIAVSILGVRAELGDEDGDDVSQWLGGYFFSLAGTIYAGANEIQRNIVAERVLGLPKG